MLSSKGDKDTAKQSEDQTIEFFKQFMSPGATEFALSMAKLLYKQDGESNVIFSPVSIYTALALVLLAAENESWTEIATVMGLSRDKNYEEADKVHDILSQILKATENTTDITIFTENEGEKNVKATVNITNGVYASNDVSLLPHYVDRARSCYKTEVSNVDFSNNPSKATDIINEFVSKSTKGRIPRLLSEPVDNSTRVLLASCVYFKATWQNQFSQDETRDENFYTGTENVLVKMMRCNKDMFYIDLPKLHLEAVCLDYAGDDLSMVVILPKPEKILNDIISSLRVQHLQQIQEQSKFENVELKLPRMKFEWTSQIKDHLVQLGITRVFDDRSQLPNLTNDPRLKISSVTHAAEIQVDENGTEASAATVIEIVNYCAFVISKTPKRFHVNRPFLVYIYHRKTKVILFFGAVHNPQKDIKR